MHQLNRPNHPGGRGATRRQKNLQVSEVQAEKFRENQAFLRLVREDFARQGVGNLEAIELGLRQALLQDGRCLLEQLLEQAGVSLADNTSRPGEKCHPERTKPVQTIFGEIELRRRYFYHAASHRSEEHTSELQSPCNLVCR